MSPRPRLLRIGRAGLPGWTPALLDWTPALLEWMLAMPEWTLALPLAGAVAWLHASLYRVALGPAAYSAGSLMNPAIPAPAVYRVGVRLVAALLLRVAGTPAYVTMAGLDALSVLVIWAVTCAALRAMLLSLAAEPLPLGTKPRLQGATLRPLEHTLRRASFALGVLVAAALLLFALLWTATYPSPDTLPAAALCAVLLGLLRGEPKPASLAHSLSAIAVFAACLLALSLVRADAAVTLGAGMIVAGYLLRGGDTVHAPRGGAGWRGLLHVRSPLVLGAAMVGVPVVVLAVLMKRIYPHASYGDVPVFQLMRNARYVHRLPPFVCFALPFAGVAWWAHYAAAVHASATADGSAAASRPADRAALWACACQLAAWAVLGRLEEVHIGIPAALLLLPLAGELAMTWAATEAA